MVKNKGRRKFKPFEEGTAAEQTTQQQEVASTSKTDFDKSNKGRRKFKPLEEGTAAEQTTQQQEVASTSKTDFDKSNKGRRKFKPLEEGTAAEQTTQQQEVASTSKTDFDKFNKGRRKFKPLEEGTAAEQTTQQQEVASISKTDFDKSNNGRRKFKPLEEGTAAEQTTQQQEVASTSNTDFQKSNKDSSSSEPKYQLLIPKPGTEGRKIRVETNYFKINLGDLKKAYHYDVTITPEHKKKYRKIMEMFGIYNFGNVSFAYDNRKNLFTAKEINDSSAGIELDDVKYQVSVKFAREIDLTPLHRIEQSLVTPRDALQLLDIVLRSAPSKSLLSAGRSFFFEPRGQAIDLKDGMELYDGFYQSAVRGSKGLYLNVDVAHKAVPKNIAVIDAIKDFFESPNYVVNLKQELKSWQYEEFDQFVKGLRISYQLKSFKKSYIINKLSKPASTQTFQIDGKGKITVADYFRDVKKCNLKYPNLPTIWVGKKEREIYLPIELCMIEKGQMLQKKLTDQNKRNMIYHTATNTKDRRVKIQKAMEKAEFNDDSSVKEFGFSVENDFLQLDARVLYPPPLMYGNKVPVTPFSGKWQKCDAFWDLARVTKWMVVSCMNNKKSISINDLNCLQKEIQKQRELGLPAATKVCKIVGDRKEDINNFFKNEVKDFDIIFVVISDKGTEYPYIKQAAELYSTCVTQCIKYYTSKSIINNKMFNIISNIMLKDNTKLNGTNHVLKTVPPILKNCMVMGADVTHPGKQTINNKTDDIVPSVAAVTASHDANAFLYNICWRLQHPTAEIIYDMETAARELLCYYKEKNKKLPDKIIYYRDGVAEGDFNKVLENEVRAIRSACFRLSPEFKPKITCIVVQKRHHTRIFPVNEKESQDKNFNVPAGTCVDTEITHPYMQEFYLVSHASIKGVARPTKYCTLLDENQISNDDLEKLTYYLCHLYSRCNRSVSYPAPTYNAHLAAARAKVYIHGEKINIENIEEVYQKLARENNIRKSNPMFFV